MKEVPSLFSVCMKTITMFMMDGYHHMEDVFELPSDLLDSLILNLPPVALQNMQELFTNCYGGLNSTTICVNGGRKRGRFDRTTYEDFNTAWKVLFKKRWPEYMKNILTVNCMTAQNGAGMSKLVSHSIDWHQLYWENHLQDCLNEAAEKAMLPNFDGRIGEVTVPDSIMTLLGYSGIITHEFSRLSYHCNKFGFYARCLRLQNVLCIPETCVLMKASKLQSLVFRRLTSETHVNGLCMLLNQNRETLVSLELIHCRLSSTNMDEICSSVYQDGTQTHGIQSFCVNSSSILESKSPSLSTGLLSFLSSGRFLHELHFCEIRMGPTFAKLIFDTLCKSSCDIVTLEISDNNIGGWLRKVDRKSTNFSVLGSATSLKSLSVLNLRGNNLCEDDVEDLNHVLVHLPNLKSLDISDNPLLDDGVRNLTPYFMKAVDKTCPLSDIKIENCSLTGKGVAELLKIFAAFKEPLNTLSIANNHLGSSIAAPLAKFFSTSHVKILDIEDIGLGPLGFAEIENEMPKEMALVSINLSKNRGGIRAAHLVSKVVRQAPNLVSVNAGYNFMPPESLDIIHDALKQAKGKLEQLDLTGNTSLCQSPNSCKLFKFKFDGSPIVSLPSFHASSMAYDDDP